MTNLGKESETVEFKESLGQLDKGEKALSAMLNKHHTGTVYFGVNDNGDVIGMDVGDSTLEKIRNAIRTDIAPQVVPEIVALTSDDGKRYVSVKVIGYSVPYSYKEKYYIRNVTSNESAGPEVVAQIVMTRGLDPLKDTRSDIQDLTFEFLFSQFVSRGQHPRDDKNYFGSWGMLDSGGCYNLNAYLLSDQNAVPMQIVEFEGTDRSKIFRRTDYGGCSLIRSMEDISEQISLRMEVNITGVNDKLDRVEVPLFDFEAFREAWVNACVHNAWRSMIPPSVMLFDDRIEVVSYGTIPFPMSDEDFFTGSSRPVNPSLFRIFAALGKIEQSGHGVPRIVESYGRKAFHIKNDGMTVIIPFAFQPSYVSARDANKVSSLDIDPQSKAVLRYLTSHPRAKMQDVADHTGLSLSSVKKRVASLKELGVLVNEGTNRNSVWAVKAPTADPVHRD